MASKKVVTDYGDVQVRNAMIDIDGTNIEEGIELKGDGFLIELVGYRDIDEITVDEVESIIENQI